MNKLSKFLLVVTGFAPATSIYFLVYMVSGHYMLAIVWLASGAIMFAICVYIIDAALKNLQDIPYKAKKVEIADNEVSGFLLIGLLPLISLVTRDLATFNWHVWVSVMLVISAVIARGHGYHFNPLLLVLKWHFYKVSDDDGMTHILISKRRLYKPDKDIIVGKLSEYTLIEKGS